MSDIYTFFVDHWRFIAKILFLLLSIYTTVFLAVRFWVNRRLVLSKHITGSELLESDLYYYLPIAKYLLQVDMKLSISIDENGSVQDYTIDEYTILPNKRMCADENNLFSLNLYNSWVSNDDAKFTINENGLLTSIDLSADDQTLHFIKKVGALPADLLGSIAPVRAKSVKSSSKTSDKETHDTVKVEEVEHSFSILWDPNKLIQNESNTGKHSIEPIDWVTPITYSGGLLSVEGRLSGSRTPFQSFAKDSDVSIPNKSINGVFTRRTRSYLFKLQLKENFEEVAFTDVIPAVGQEIKIPINRFFFDKSEYTMTFKEGLIQENHIIQPAELVGIVDVPMEILRSIFSIPGALIGAMLNINSNKTNLLEARKKLLDKQLDHQKHMLSKELELENSILQLKKEMAEAKASIEKKDTDAKHKTIMETLTQLEKRLKDLESD